MHILIEAALQAMKKDQAIPLAGHNEACRKRETPPRFDNYSAQELRRPRTPCASVALCCISQNPSPADRFLLIPRPPNPRPSPSVFGFTDTACLHASLAAAALVPVRNREAAVHPALVSYCLRLDVATARRDEHCDKGDCVRTPSFVFSSRNQIGSRV